MNKGTISVLSMLTGAAIGTGICKKIKRDRLSKEKKMADKHLALFLMMNQWVRVKQEGKKLSSYFEKRGFKKIAIYGMSYAGETLIDELKDTAINIVYAIDKNANSIYTEVEVVLANDYLEPVDAVVVTAITFFDEIKELLAPKLNCEIISLEEVLYGV